MKYYFNLTGKAFKPVPSDKKDFREAKQHEIKTAKQHRRQIKSIKNRIHRLKQKLKDAEECHHLVFYDEGGYMYDNRVCVACGKTDLI